jgi:hypothetical protein
MPNSSGNNDNSKEIKIISSLISCTSAFKDDELKLNLSYAFLENTRICFTKSWKKYLQSQFKITMVLLDLAYFKSCIVCQQGGQVLNQDILNRIVSLETSIKILFGTEIHLESLFLESLSKMFLDYDEGLLLDFINVRNVDMEKKKKILSLYNLAKQKVQNQNQIQNQSTTRIKTNSSSSSIVNNL